MVALAGKTFCPQVSTDDVTYNDVEGCNEASMTIDGDNIDVTVFKEEFVNRIQGLKDCSWSLSGFWEPTDTTGQIAIQNALLNDTTLYSQIIYSGTSGFKQEVKVSSFEISASVDGEQAWSAELEGTGAVSLVP